MGELATILLIIAEGHGCCDASAGSAEDYILTAAHVVHGGSKIEIVTGTGTLAATVVKVDATNDVALLKCAGTGFTPVPIASSKNVRVGSSVFTLGLHHTTTANMHPAVFGEATGRIIFNLAIAQLTESRLLAIDYQTHISTPEGMGDKYAGHATRLEWCVIENKWSELRRPRQRTQS